MANTNVPPGGNPQVWQLQQPLPDDLRLHPLSLFQGFGLLDTVPVIFADGFESGDTSAW